MPTGSVPRKKLNNWINYYYPSSYIQNRFPSAMIYHDFETRNNNTCNLIVVSLRRAPTNQGAIHPPRLYRAERRTTDSPIVFSGYFLFFFFFLYGLFFFYSVGTLTVETSQKHTDKPEKNVFPAAARIPTLTIR